MSDVELAIVWPKSVWKIPAYFIVFECLIPPTTCIAPFAVGAAGQKEKKHMSITASDSLIWKSSFKYFILQPNVLSHVNCTQ